MALTKVTGQVIKNTTDVTVGVLTVTNTLAVGGTVSIGGTLTYEDVTNVDAVGLITARNGIVVGSGITLSKDGDGFFTGIVTATSFAGDGSALTGVASTDNIRTNTNATFLQNINVSGTTTTAGITNTIASGNVIALLDSSNASQNHRVRINSQGASSSTSLVISNSNANNQTSLVHGNDGVFSIRNGQTAGSEPTSGTERLRIASDGLITATQPNSAIGLIVKNSAHDSQLQILATASNKNSVIFFGDDADDDIGQIDYDHNNNSLAFTVNTSEALRIDSSGRLLIGTNSSLQTYAANPSLQVAGTSFDTSTLLLRRDQNNANPPAVVFGKSRGSAGGNTVVQDDDQVGSLIFAAADGTDLTSIAAEIKVQIDGTPGSNDVPGRITFNTTADGAASPTERLRIASNGDVHLGDYASQSGIFGKARLNIRGADDIATSFNLANSYLHIGGAESTLNGLYPISFGHTKSDSTKASSYMGAKVVDAAGYEKTALVFATRDVTSDDAPTERMRIDNKGYITMPTQCSVAVRMSAAQTSWPGDNSFTIDNGRLAFDTELWDIGGNFNTSNYTFTAPVAGRYLMVYHIQFENFTNFTWVYMYPVVNDSVSDSAARGISFSDFGPGSNAASGTYYTISHSVIANLQANDTVKFKVRGSVGGGQIKGGTESQWNINLLN